MTAAAFERYADDLARFADDALDDSATILARAVEAELRADTGDGMLSHGRHLGRATVEIDASAGEAEVAAAGSMAVWAIIQRGTTAHTVRAAPGKALSTPHGPRVEVHVSGAPARRTWTRGNERGLPEVQSDLERRFSRIGA